MDLNDVDILDIDTAVVKKSATDLQILNSLDDTVDIEKEDVVILINVPILVVVVLIMNEPVIDLIEQRALVIAVEMLIELESVLKDDNSLDVDEYVVK